MRNQTKTTARGNRNETSLVSLNQELTARDFTVDEGDLGAKSARSCKRKESRENAGVKDLLRRVKRGVGGRSLSETRNVAGKSSGGGNGGERKEQSEKPTEKGERKERREEKRRKGRRG